MQTQSFAPAVLFAVISSAVISEAATPHQEDRYAPMRMDIPDTTGDYAVLAVLTEDNFVCMRPGEKRLVLQSLQPDIDGALRSFPQLQSELAQSDLSIVGPGLTRDQLVSQLDLLYHSFKESGCATLQLPQAPSCPDTGGGECKNTEPSPGFTIIQNTDIHAFCPSAQSPCLVNAQSVILVAPTVGHNQGGIDSDPIYEAACSQLDKDSPKCLAECKNVLNRLTGSCNHHPGYSAFLNNGMTDKGYFLQVGLVFFNKAIVAADGTVSAGDEVCRAPAGCFGEGLVVWAGAMTNGVTTPPLKGHSHFSASSNAQPAIIPYIAGHHYYTTITRTSGVWWTCAADLENPSTYQCQNHPDAQDSDHLIADRNGTNVFAEVWNQNRDWARGFTVQWPAYGATTYLNGLPHAWKSQAVWTGHSCPDAWPTTSAVVGSLVPDGRQFNDGWAFFNADGYIPAFCF